MFVAVFVVAYMLFSSLLVLTEFVVVYMGKTSRLWTNMANAHIIIMAHTHLCDENIMYVTTNTATNKSDENCAYYEGSNLIYTGRKAT